MENEELDLSRSRRWQRVRRAVEDGQPPEEIAALMGETLLRTLQKLQKEIPIDRLLDAWAEGPQAVEAVSREWRGCGGDDFIALFAETSRGAASREDAVCAFAMAICDLFNDQIALKAAKREDGKTLPEIHTDLDAAKRMVAPVARDLARKLDADPSAGIRVPQDGRARQWTQTEAVLNDSLLGGRP